MYLLISLCLAQEPTLPKTQPEVTTTEEVKVEEVVVQPEEVKLEETTEEVKSEETTVETTVETTEEALEETIATTDEEALKDAKAFYKAVETQDWPLATGFLVMLLVYASNRFGLKEKVGAHNIPYVSLALGILSSVGVSLASGGSISVALEAGVIAGLAAVGSWETVFKKFLK